MSEKWKFCYYRIFNFCIPFQYYYILLSCIVIGLRVTNGLVDFAKGMDILIPCYPQDSVFYSGECIFCTRPNRYENAHLEKNCTAFISNKISDVKESFLFEVKSSEDNSNPKTCDKGFGCLRNPPDIKKLSHYIGEQYLKGRNLRAVTIERRPFVKTSGGNYHGVCFEFFYAMQIKYNFTTNIFLPYDGNWGAATKNGTWDGMIGQIIRKEADIGVAGFSVTLERAKVVSFTQTFHQEPSGILIPPPTEGEKLSVLVRPLYKEVWLSLLVTMGFLAPTFYTMHIISLKISGEKDTKSVAQFFGDLLNFMIGSLVQESVVSPMNKTTRFLIILWWFLTLIVANIYVGYLVSYLSAPKLQTLINGLEDLTKQNRIKWTFRKNSALQSLFMSNTSSGVYKAMGDGVIEDALVNSDSAGAEIVLTGKYAFVKEKSYLHVALSEDFKKSHKCRMTVAKEVFFKVETAFIVQKQSKFLDLLDHEISWTVATGLMDKWKMIHWPRGLWCEDAASYIANTQPKTRKLALNDLQGAGFLLGCGISISILSFITEGLLSCFKTLIRPPQSSRFSINILKTSKSADKIDIDKIPIDIRLQIKAQNHYNNTSPYYSYTD